MQEGKLNDFLGLLDLLCAPLLGRLEPDGLDSIWACQHRACRGKLSSPSALPYMLYKDPHS